MNTSSSFASSVPGGGAAPLDLVIFGGVGDLSLRKLLPALYQAHQHHHLPVATRIHVLGRQAWDRDAFVAAISARVLAFIEPEHRDPAACQAFLASLNYLTVDATRADDYLSKNGVFAIFRFCRVSGTGFANRLRVSSGNARRRWRS